MEPNEVGGAVSVLKDEFNRRTLRPGNGNKRQIAIDMALEFWDELLADIDIPILPDSWIDPAIRNAIPVAVGWFYDLVTPGPQRV